MIAGGSREPVEVIWIVGAGADGNGADSRRSDAGSGGDERADLLKLALRELDVGLVAAAAPAEEQVAHGRFLEIDSDFYG